MVVDDVVADVVADDVEESVTMVGFRDTVLEGSSSLVEVVGYTVTHVEGSGKGKSGMGMSWRLCRDSMCRFSGMSIRKRMIAKILDKRVLGESNIANCFDSGVEDASKGVGVECGPFGLAWEGRKDDTLGIISN